MNILNTTVICLAIFTIVYMILKTIQCIQMNKQKSSDIKVLMPHEIEIVSRDLYIKAQNLIELSEVYELQISQLMHGIDDIEYQLQIERTTSIVQGKNSNEINILINKSLKMQERKCILESKVLKINKELNDLALEEYRRQMA